MERLKTCLVGLGFGRQVIENMLLKEPAAALFDLAAICDTDPERLQWGSERYGIKGYASLEEVLSDESFKVIILISGPNGRAELIRKIIRSGKDVVTTKPFELDSKAAAAVLAETRELGRMVYLNSPCAAEPDDFATIRRWQKDYNLGRLVGGHHECWYKSVEQASGSWYDDPERCPVAPIFRLGIYGINDVVRLFGEPVEVQVMETRIFTGRPTPDLATMNIRFADGCIVTMMDGWVPQPGRGAQSLILYFENGTIFRNPTMLPQYPIDKTGPTIMTLVTKDCEDGMPLETVELQPDQLSSHYQWEVYHKAFTTRERPENETPDSAIVDSVRVIEAMKLASQEKRSVQLERNSL